MLLMTLCFQSSPAWSLDRFVDLNDGTMLDTVSSLRWLKNANCYGQQNWATAISSANSLASPSCGLSDGSMTGDWHLPTIDELSVFVNTVYLGGMLNAAGFNNVQASYYWSSSADSNVTGSAWGVGMGNGYVYSNYEGYISYLWPVRAGQYWSLGSLVVLGAPDFGNQMLGSVSSGHQFTLKNNGATSLSVTSITLSGSDSSQFSLASGGD